MAALPAVDCVGLRFNKVYTIVQIHVSVPVFLNEYTYQTTLVIFLFLGVARVVPSSEEKRLDCLSLVAF